MTAKSAFDAEQWARITEAPALVAMRVMTATRGGTLREGVSLARTYAEARRDGGDGLVDEIIRSAPTLDPGEVRGPDELRERADRVLRGALADLDRVAEASEAGRYREFVRRLAETVARAHREGGFLGVGGTEVSDPERAVLDEIAAVLDAPPAAAP